VGCPAFSLGEKAEIKPREFQSLNSQLLRDQRLRDEVYIAGEPEPKVAFASMVSPEKPIHELPTKEKGGEK
jgi:hypothetical protein